MARRWGDRPVVPVAVAWAVAFVVAAHLLTGDSFHGRAALPIVSIGALISLVSMLWCHGSGTRLSGWGVTAGAAIYTGGLLSHAPLLRALDDGREWVLLLLFVTFVADSSAFFVGRAVGRRPLFLLISPSKTWEGAVGGVAGGLGASVAAVYVLGLEAGVGHALVLGALIGTVGQIGDMVESLLKRIAGVKDSGRLLPGHGGVLDRLDSIVFSLVLVYYLVS
jgi:phosphatidate cytidylyltransferase